jgi:hypothetical protein
MVLKTFRTNAKYLLRIRTNSILSLHCIWILTFFRLLDLQYIYRYHSNEYCISIFFFQALNFFISNSSEEFTKHTSVWIGEKYFTTCKWRILENSI